MARQEQKEGMMLKIFRHHIPMWSLLELIADGVLCFAIVLVVADRFLLASAGIQHISQITLSAAAFAAFMAFLYSCVGLYRRGAIHVSLASLAGRGVMALLMGSCIAYLLLARKHPDAAMLLLLNAVPMLAAGVIIVRSMGYLARRTAVGVRRVLIVGTGPEAWRVAADLTGDGAERYSVVGFYPTSDSTGNTERHDDLTQRIFSSALSVDDVVRQQRVDEIIVAVREQRGGGVPMDQLLTCRIGGVPVLDLAGFFERAKGEVPIDSLKASWLVYGLGFAQGGLRTAVKRLFDILMSMLLLIVASPIMLVAALAIKLESHGPIIYRQERVGLRGRSFMCLKFRSMSIDAEKDGVARWATKNDARVTRIGAFMRKARIDELPQLLSVLKGEMSLVGPRPERPAFVRQLQADIPFYDIRHSVKPGVTGWAQVRYSYGASVEDARKKHQFDLYYVKNHSLFLDLMVILETVSVVLFREGSQ
jgi:sugar transferase (PEP-CTERM system associated)